MENKKTQLNKDLVSYMDTIFMISGEMIKNNGEDSFSYAVRDNYGILSVFDGCGGIGSRKYDVYANKTGAYISSHTVSKVFFEWFLKFLEEKKDLSGNTMNEIKRDLHSKIDMSLKKLEEGTTVSTIKGSLAKSFPTTVSSIMFTYKENKIYSSFIWAGDSRGYILTSEGLSQITEDDVDGEEDAMSNLSSDARLSNVVYASGDYKLNCKIITCKEPMLLITATDGCFGYFQTPMEFEYMIIKTLTESKNVDEWKKSLGEYIKKYTGDDYTMGVVAFGYESFKNMKKSFLSRRKILSNYYIEKLPKATNEEKQYMWEEYKKVYYKGV